MNELGISFLSDWGWVICGILMMMAEFAIPGIFMIWIGIGAVLTGIICMFLPDLSVSVQLLIFAVFSMISVFLGWFIYGRVFGKSQKEEYSDLNQGTKEFIGKKYPLISDVKNGQAQIKIGDSVWPVRTEENMRTGEMVTVSKVDGMVLYVSKEMGKNDL